MPCFPNYVKKCHTYTLFLEYTDLSMSQIMQRQSIHYSGNMGALRYLISQVAGLLESIEGDKKMRAFNAIDITLDHKIVTLEVIYFYTQHEQIVIYNYNNIF